MSKLLVKANKGHGRVAHVTPQIAGWTYVGFDLHRLKPGESASGKTEDREVCLVFVTGKGKASAGGKDLGLLGERMSPFEGKPWSVYVPQGSDWSVTAGTELELAVCSAPGLGGGLPVRVIAPDDLGQEVRGKGTNTRYVTNILPEGKPADSLLVVEVITPGGHPSSYPPHKHDQDNL
ncbi:5-deoxy-glucuronate isomerase, partial [Mesorhizobium sp. M7D.F.Ca.US.004.03.1.1]|uniref:5-deoxy-glucuronate isomerase n=1 Tax=Mesorhizobium sp. M7D.F.Ca.US.004.03.1.1 TaxID=2496702 RepID=UPI000FCB7E89